MRSVSIPGDYRILQRQAELVILDPVEWSYHILMGLPCRATPSKYGIFGVLNIVDYFEGVKDPRVVGRCKHKLSDILVIALASYLCGAEDYESMHELCLKRGESLRPLVELPNGTPSTDTFERVL